MLFVNDMHILHLNDKLEKCKCNGLLLLSTTSMRVGLTLLDKEQNQLVTASLPYIFFMPHTSVIEGKCGITQYSLMSISKLFCLAGRWAALEALRCTVIPAPGRLSCAWRSGCALASLSGFFLSTGVDVERVKPLEGECLRPWLGDSSGLTEDSRELRLNETQLESLDRPDSCTGPVCRQ